MNKNYLSWTDFKTNIGDYTLYYIERAKGYTLIFKDANNVYNIANLNVYANIIDFETNYKSSGTKINNINEVE